MDKINCRYYVRGGGQFPQLESEIWFAVKNEDAHMLASDVYDAFVLVPLYLAMYYKQDLHIHGPVSKRLYKNIMNYFQRILCDFSDKLSRVNVKVDGFKIAEGEPGLIGAGISCGVDSLSTIYEHYVKEDDKEYKVNALFFYNCGSHGTFGEKSEHLFFERYKLNKSAADELGLPVYLINSNLHAFVYVVGDDMTIGHFARFSCILALQIVIKKYYISSCFSYSQVLTNGYKMRNYSLAEFSESYLVPLVRTEKCELIIDGCQYERTRKTELIADWEIAQKYLNVCVGSLEDAHNCSKCPKCLRTLIALEAMNKLKKFAGVFDIETYKKHSYRHKCKVALGRNMDAMLRDNYDFCRKHGMKFPSRLVAFVYVLPSLNYAICKKFLKRIAGEKFYSSIKRLIHHNPSA